MTDRFTVGLDSADKHGKGRGHADEDAAVLVSGPLRALLSITAQNAGTRIGLWPR